jgi:uncharacterized membrane protein
MDAAQIAPIRDFLLGGEAAMSGAWLAAFSLPDWIAMAWFLVCWMGYGWVVEHGPLGSTRGLLGASHGFRLEWGRQMLRRDNRMADVALIGNLMQNVSFYANTTIYVIAGLLALLGTMDRLIDVASDLPFARHVSREVWEVKLLLLLMVFIVAYFKFTWSLRQFNMLSLVVGAAPPPGEGSEEDARRFARINALSGTSSTGASAPTTSGWRRCSGSSSRGSSWRSPR